MVEVSGGTVTNVWNVGRNWAVLDWDNLLGDGADTVHEWNELPPAVQEFIRRECPAGFAKSADAMARNAAASTLPKR